MSNKSSTTRNWLLIIIALVALVIVAVLLLRLKPQPDMTATVEPTAVEPTEEIEPAADPTAKPSLHPPSRGPVAPYGRSANRPYRASHAQTPPLNLRSIPRLVGRLPRTGGSRTAPTGRPMRRPHR